MLDTYVRCDVGLKRKINEDSFLVDKQNNFAIVSDGMGGYEKGEIASAFIVEEFAKQLQQYVNLGEKQYTKDKIISYLNKANERSSKKISIYAKNHNIKKTIGATVVGLYFATAIDKLVLFHLGDSRIYKIYDNKIEQITVDHSIGNNVLSRAIGNFDIFELEINFIDFKKEDIYLIRSDGIYNYISNKELLDVIINEKLDSSCDIIKNIVYKNGAKDNLTLIITKYK